MSEHVDNLSEIIESVEDCQGWSDLAHMKDFLPALTAARDALRAWEWLAKRDYRISPSVDVYGESTGFGIFPRSGLTNIATGPTPLAATLAAMNAMEGE